MPSKHSLTHPITHQVLLFLCFAFLVLTASGVVITAAITVTGSVKSTRIIVVTVASVVVVVTTVVRYGCLSGIARR